MGITGGTAQTARTLLYGAITLVLGDDSVYGAIDGGNGQVTPLVAALLPYLMRYTEGGTQRTYESFAAAADGNFRQAAPALMPSDPATAETLSALGPQLRTLLNATLFSASEAPYDLGYNVCILSTVLTSTDAIVLANRPQTYVAFARAANRLYETNHGTTPVTPEDHTDTQVRPVPSEPGKGTRPKRQGLLLLLRPEHDLLDHGCTALPHTRYGGRDRYDTCVRVADWAGAHGLSWTRVAVASGTSFPDALAGSALAGSKGAVTPLCSDASTDAATTLSAHAGSVRELLVFGGTSAVSDSLVTRLAKAAA